MPFNFRMFDNGGIINLRGIVLFVSLVREVGKRVENRDKWVDQLLKDQGLDPDIAAEMVNSQEPRRGALLLRLLLESPRLWIQEGQQFASKVTIYPL